MQVIRFLPAIMLCLSACSSGDNGAERHTDAIAGGPEDQARRVVAEHTGTDPADISIVTLEAIEFADSSLGCPQPGVAYLQVITPGYQATAAVEVNGTPARFDVRISGQQGFICPGAAALPRDGNTTGR